MELRVSDPEPGLLPSVCKYDVDAKEISDDDDYDRNHKHHRREDARSESLEGDALEPAFTKPYRRGSKPLKDGHLYREGGSQSNITWKSYNVNPIEKDMSAKFDKRYPECTPFSRGSSDWNQRISVNQAFSGNPGPVRGRGRDSGLWSEHDFRFSSVDIASQIVQQGFVPPSLFTGRGFPTIPSAHGASWSAFGFFPGIPNGGLDTLHPLGLQGPYRPAINPSLNMGLARQRCRDFEEQGFCLRGDVCPMEHGVNCIVIEDVQSLSQFNLSVPLPSANLPGTPAGTGSSPSTSTLTNSLLDSKGSNGKSSKLGVGDNRLGFNGTFIDSAAAATGRADFYDPDQPLWANDSQTSTAPNPRSQSNVEENESLMDSGTCGDHCVGLSDGCKNEQVVRSAGTAVGSQNTSLSVWARIGSTKNKTEMRGNVISKASPSTSIHTKTKKNLEPSSSAQGVPLYGKWNNVDSSLKVQSGNGPSGRKPTQKAQRTLFVNGIPQQNNRRESLLSHFQKFGEVIDIYIPGNGEQAFVQFSKREEAETALTAPDALMGNRFIKLWWANRDNIPDNRTISGHCVPIPPHGVAVSSVLPYISIANKGKGDPQSALCNGIIASASDHPKPVVANNANALPSLQKKLDSLEFLKEELRKKQEMLDQKRNDFRHKLDKLEKQATGLKGEVAPEQVVKKQKSGMVVDLTKAATPNSSDPSIVLHSTQGEVTTSSSKLMECAGSQSPKTTALLAVKKPSSLKPSICPVASVEPSFVTNRFKLDNRPTAFRIIPPVPNDLADVAVLKEHFSQYGNLSELELDDTEPIDDNDPETSKASVRIYFTTRHSAEKAFFSGKCWKGHNLQFIWLKPSKSSKDLVGGESPSSNSKGNSDASIEPVVEISNRNLLYLEMKNLKNLKEGTSIRRYRTR